MKLDVLGILETKLALSKLEELMVKKFSNWNQINNFEDHTPGRIIVLWNPQRVKLELISKNPQAIHCSLSCIVSSKSFYVSFVYGLHTIVARRPLWQSIRDFSMTNTGPWMLLGKFNNVLYSNERRNGSEVTAYDTKDIKECFNECGLSDLSSSGSFFTWSNGRSWSKLDRAIANRDWFMAGLGAHAFFQLPGIYSDHASCTITLLEDDDLGRRTFKYFNMWGQHCNFQDVVRKVWSRDVAGCRLFRLATKLKALKGPLKELNQLHFSHISSRAEKAACDLLSAQQGLHDDPGNSDLQMEVIKLKEIAGRLDQANRSFISQQVKTRFLNNSDRNSKFFYALLKRNTTRNHILN
ncbi:uncharacterized protein LOC131158650 [Malania oleifera]|uniref:uncharacterized protein LOC131158650 n=1 Tax=Malania oleifera TaxID=397392 RepID=UPI0025ADF336|nr:uncharacterized protein LOC131158650 [Malania oleifera]